MGECLHHRQPVLTGQWTEPVSLYNGQSLVACVTSPRFAAVIRRWTGIVAVAVCVRDNVLEGIGQDAGGVVIFTESLRSAASRE